MRLVKKIPIGNIFLGWKGLHMQRGKDFPRKNIPKKLVKKSPYRKNFPTPYLGHMQLL